MDKGIDAFPAPISPGKQAAAILVLFPTGTIRKIFIVIIGGIWVEIIIKMNPVNIIALYDIHYYVYAVILRFFQRRIKPPVTLLKRYHQFRFCFYQRYIADRTACYVMRPVGVQPGMQ